MDTVGIMGRSINVKSAKLSSGEYKDGRNQTATCLCARFGWKRLNSDAKLNCL